MYSAEAWVLYQGDGSKKPQRGRLVKEPYTFSDISDNEVLCEPIYGCWEANMCHAISRQPIDVCRDRGEEKIVMGNAGVVRVLKVGAAVGKLREGDMCLVFGNGEPDQFGYMKKALGYDAAGSMGIMATRAKLHQRNLIPIPRPTPYSLQQWAAFSLRYITAWANWRVAYGSWRVQMTEEDQPIPYVWGWGGGTTLAELSLAQKQGASATMIASTDARLRAIESLGISAVDRRTLPELSFDEAKYKSDPQYRKAYNEAEHAFLSLVRERTNGLGVSIFIDYIGTPVARATLRALARQGVLATAGWKHGMATTSMRAVECIARHTHVHTHYARYSEGVDAVAAAHKLGWMPPLDRADKVYDWSEVDKLADDYYAGKVESYFPLFRINPI